MLKIHPHSKLVPDTSNRPREPFHGCYAGIRRIPDDANRARSDEAIRLSCFCRLTVGGFGNSIYPHGGTLTVG